MGENLYFIRYIYVLPSGFRHTPALICQKGKPFFLRCTMQEQPADADTISVVSRTQVLLLKIHG